MFANFAKHEIPIIVSSIAYYPRLSLPNKTRDQNTSAAKITLQQPWIWSRTTVFVKTKWK